MPLPISIPNTFAGVTTSIPLSQLDNNFTTVVNGVNGIGNGTNSLANVSITGGAIANASVASANVTITGGTISNTTVTFSPGLSVSNGGTGYSTLTANNVILGNGTSAVQFVAPGTAGFALVSNGTTWVSSPPSAATSVNLQAFTVSGTWTKPVTATFVMVEAWGAGGGGGSGSRVVLGNASMGGGGGGGGAYAYRVFAASELTSTVTVTIGAGGTGGTAISVDSTNGNNGVTGGNTTFGSFITAYGGFLGGLGDSPNGKAWGGGGGGVLSAPTVYNQGGQPFGSTDISGQFSGAAGVLNGGAGRASGFGGGSGGGATSAGTNSVGGSSYQGGAGGGGGG